MSKLGRALVTLTVTLGLTLGSGGGVAFASDAGTVSTGDVSAALDNTDARSSDLIEGAQSSTSDGDSAAQTAIADIPTDPAEGVKLKADNGRTFTIGLPDAARSGRGVKTHKGVVAYSGSGDSANAVIPTSDGVQLLTTIDSRRAPTRYTYDVQASGGAFVRVQPDGSALVLAKDGKSGYTIAKPWARDANGRNVPTHFATDGASLTQVVNHRAGHYAYPVTADPRWSWWWGGVDIYMSRGEMGYILNGGTAAVVGLFTAGYAGMLGISAIEQAVQNAWPQNRCVVLRLSWVRPSYTSTYAC